MSFRFLHTGDLHLDSPFAGLTTEAPANVAETLREATLETWRAIVQLALNERVDFVLVAGDVFEQANRTLRGQIRFRDGLAELARVQIPSFVVTGNHDPLSGWEPSVTWPELAHRFPARTVSSVPVLRDGEEIARIYGVSYHVRDVTTNLASHFKREAAVSFAVGLLHANVGAIAGRDNCAPCTLQDLRAADMDYWALGHIHRHAVLAAGRPTVVYCGNPQGRDPGEVNACGCYLVTVDDAGTIHPEFRPTDVVRWQLVDVSIVDARDEDSLIDHVTGAVDEARSAADRAIVARVTLKGRGAMHGSLQRPGFLADVRTMSQERLGEAMPFAWIESVRDETRAELDLADRRLADDFLGDLLRRFDEARTSLREANADDAPDATGPPDPVLAQLEGSLDSLYCHERARRYLREVRPDRARLMELLDEAESMVADLLGGEA